MKQMQQPQFTPMKKMEVDMRSLDAEEEKAQQGLDLHSVIDLHFRYRLLNEYKPPWQ